MPVCLPEQLLCRRVGRRPSAIMARPPAASRGGCGPQARSGSEAEAGEPSRHPLDVHRLAAVRGAGERQLLVRDAEGFRSPDSTSGSAWNGLTAERG